MNQGIGEEASTSKLTTLIRGKGTTSSLLSFEAEAIFSHVIAFDLTLMPLLFSDTESSPRGLSQPSTNDF